MRCLLDWENRNRLGFSPQDIVAFDLFGMIRCHSNFRGQKMKLNKLIDEDRLGGVFRVHRSAFTSTEIAALEQANIFQRCWLYLGHDSELPNAGDFRRRTVAGQPLFWVRG